MLFHQTISLHRVHQVNVTRTPGKGYDAIRISIRTCRDEKHNFETIDITCFLRLDESKLIVRKIGDDSDDLIGRMIRVPGVIESKTPDEAYAELP